MGQKLKFIHILIYFLCLLQTSLLHAEVGNPKVQSISTLDWEYSIDAEELFKTGNLWATIDTVNWEKLNKNHDPIYESRNSKPPIIWTRVKLPEIKDKNTFYLRKYFLSSFFDVYFHSEKIYSYDLFLNSDFKPLTVKLDYIPLPSTKSGEYLYLRTDFLVKFDYALSSQIWIGRLGDLLEINIAHSILPLLLSIGIFSIGIIALLVFIINWKNSYVPLFYFSIMNLTIGTAIFSKNDLIYILYNNPLFYSFFIQVAGVIIPIGIVGFFSHTLGKNLTNTTKIIQKLNLVLLFVFILSYSFLLFPERYFAFGVVNHIIQLIYLFEFAYILYACIKMAKNNIDARIISFGMLSLAVFFLLYLFYLYIFFQSTNLPIWGCLLFLVSMGIALERDFRLKRTKLILLKKEFDIYQNALHLANLNRLKEKLSPHFFFNSLNTLHAYASINSKLAKISIDSMIQNYKFLEDHVDSNLVPFEKEWEFTKVYCRLQKVRFLDRVKIKFKKIGDFSSLLIPPLSIQPLVENAFKHGFQNSMERIWKIQIDAVLLDNRISISVNDNGSGIEYKENILSRSLGNIKYRFNYFFKESSIQMNESEMGGASVKILYSTDIKNQFHEK